MNFNSLQLIFKKEINVIEYFFNKLNKNSKYLKVDSL